MTGGAGLIGSHLVDELLARGRRVRVLDDLNPETHPRGRPDWVPAEVEFLQGDVRRVEDLERALEGVTEVFHQAAYGGFTARISTYNDVNATGTARIYEVIARRGLTVRKVVVASSQAVYGEGLYRRPSDGARVQPPPRPLDRLERGEWEVPDPETGEALEPLATPEGAGLNGETAYAVSKLAEERTALGLGRQLGVPTVALRYAVTFGPRQSVFNPYTGIVSIFSTLLLNGRRPTVYEDGRQTRDFVFVRDVARANLAVMDDPRADGRAFNVARGEAIPVADLVTRRAAAWGLEAGHDLPGAFRPGDVRHLVLDPGALRALGWRPDTGLDEGLERTVAWIRGLGELGEYFTAALERLREQGVVRG